MVINSGLDSTCTTLSLNPQKTQGHPPMQQSTSGPLQELQKRHWVPRERTRRLIGEHHNPQCMWGVGGPWGLAQWENSSYNRHIILCINWCGPLLYRGSRPVNSGKGLHLFQGIEVSILASQLSCFRSKNESPTNAVILAVREIATHTDTIRWEQTLEFNWIKLSYCLL